MVLALLEERHDRIKEDAHTPVIKVVEQIAVKPFLSAGADELIKDMMYSLAESQNFQSRAPPPSD